MQDTLKAEMRNQELILQHIQELAQQLYLNVINISLSLGKFSLMLFLFQF